MAEPVDVDVLLVGASIGAAACATALRRQGIEVALVPGAARPRFVDADAGLVDYRVLAGAFPDAASAAPLGHEIRAIRRITDGADTPETARRVFRRVELEAWIRQQASDAGVRCLDGFTEGLVIPRPDGALELRSEDNRDRVVANVVALCEGADPRIAMRAGLRPDYPPEEQVHLATSRIAQSGSEPGVTHAMRGPWRTSWRMPIDLAVTPLLDGYVVQVAARIENVMRCNRSTMDALEDALANPMLREILPGGERVASGVELLSVRSTFRTMRLASDALIVGVDAAGVIDPRAVARWDTTIGAGLLLAGYLRSGMGGEGDENRALWRDLVSRHISEAGMAPSPWHDDDGTGYIEEGAAAGRLATPVRRLGRGLLARIRRYARAW